MNAIVKKFEAWVMYFMIIIGMLFVLYQMTELVYVFIRCLRQSVFQGVFSPKSVGYGIGAVFFNVLLTMEIIETVKVFTKDHRSKLRIILLVGLIAVTRKILLLDATHAEPMTEIATAILIIALSTGYYLISRSEAMSMEQRHTDN